MDRGALIGVDSAQTNCTDASRLSQTWVRVPSHLVILACDDNDCDSDCDPDCDSSSIDSCNEMSRGPLR